MSENKKPLVLVVDDNAKVLRFVEIDLKIRGFGVITTTSGAEALRLIESARPDIVLLDIIMPEMDGLEVLRRLQGLKAPPVIAFSASPGRHETTLRLGAADFMVKPFHPEDLARKIEEILGRRG